MEKGGSSALSDTWACAEIFRPFHGIDAIIENWKENGEEESGEMKVIKSHLRALKVVQMLKYWFSGSLGQMEMKLQQRALLAEGGGVGSPISCPAV